MAKGIYALRIFLFRNQFKLTKQEKYSLVELNRFIIKCYAMNWFIASNSEIASLNDIRILRKLHEYCTINKTISESTVGKLFNPLYYLNEDCSTFSLFDRRVDSPTKLLIAKKISEDIEKKEDDGREENETLKKLILKKGDVTFFFNDNEYTIFVKLIGRKSQKVFK